MARWRTYTAGGSEADLLDQGGFQNDRSIWLCDAQADLPSVAEGAGENDLAFTVLDTKLWYFTVGTWTEVPLGGGSGAPTDADYLVGTANGSLSNEIVVGATPGGELGGTWASPTVDATHSGSTHTAATTTHEAAADPHTGYLRESVLSEANAVDLTDGGETALHSHAGSGSTIAVEEDNAAVGDASVLDFGSGFDVTFGTGEADIAIDLTEVTAFTDHSARHEDGGADEISLTGLSGDSAAMTALRGVDFLVGTTTGELTGEIVAGTAPGGELGGTWASPTVDATHSGSAHHSQSHDHSAAGDGTALRPATLDIPSAAAPTPTTLAEIQYGTTENALFVGDGTGTKQFLPTVDATSDPAAVSTAAADGTEDTAARKDHVHAHEAAHINHDTTWAAKGDLITGTANDTAAVTSVGADGRFLVADSAQAGGVAWSDHGGAADPHTGYRLESADHTHASAGLQGGTIDHGALTGLTDDDHTQYLKESDVDAVTFTIGAFFETTGTLTTGTRPIWRAPFACTVTQVRGYVDTGTTTVINAGKGATSASDFCSSNITIDPADAWETGTVNQNTSISAGDTISVEIVTAGTATQLTIQVELTRDLSP